MRRVVKPTPVPLSGFLYLSAVSQQTQASRPCFVPLPFLRFLLQSFPLTKGRAPLSRPTAPLRLSTGVLERASRDLVTVRFADAHALTQLPGSPNDYGLPFHIPSTASTGKPASTTSRTLPGCPGSQATEPNRSASFTHFEACHLPRVRSHRHELPRASGRYSPEFLPL